VSIRALQNVSRVSFLRHFKKIQCEVVSLVSGGQRLGTSRKCDEESDEMFGKKEWKITRLPAGSSDCLIFE
jgi:hypothetical protein